MEKELFDWKDWDQHDTMLFGFYKVVLKKKIGPYEAGQQLAYAEVNYEDGRLVLCEKEEPSYETSITLQIT